MKYIKIYFLIYNIIHFSSFILSYIPPQVNDTWSWQLQGDGNVDMTYNVTWYDVDMFDTSTTNINYLHDRGIYVICYISVGSWENWRNDADQFPDNVKGNKLDGWAGEKWLDYRNQTVLDIMEERFQTAFDKGCDAIEPDNVDGYTNNPGFDLDYNDQITYNEWLATTVHNIGMSIALKNDIDQISDLIDDFDFFINEQCYEYEECDIYDTAISSGKAVFGVEYKEENPDVDEVCDDANSRSFSWIIKKYDLGTYRKPCWDLDQSTSNSNRLNINIILSISSLILLFYLF